VSTDNDPEDALALQVGQVARAHVWLGNSLVDVRVGLEQLNASIHSTGYLDGTVDLVRACRRLLGETTLDDRFRVAAERTMEAALSANPVVGRVGVPAARVAGGRTERSGVVNDQLRKTV